MTCLCRYHVLSFVRLPKKSVLVLTLKTPRYTLDVTAQQVLSWTVTFLLLFEVANTLHFIMKLIPGLFQACIREYIYIYFFLPTPYSSICQDLDLYILYICVGVFLRQYSSIELDARTIYLNKAIQCKSTGQGKISYFFHH